MAVHDFGGKCLVSIRDYLEKDGKQLFSGKGNVFIVFLPSFDIRYICQKNYIRVSGGIDLKLS